MLSKSLKTRLKAHRASLGVFLKSYSPWLVEGLGLLGFQCVILDMEHGALGPAECEHIIRAAETTNIPCLVRVPEVHHNHLLPCLDAGAVGVVLPHLRSSEQVQLASDKVRYPPEGKRSVARWRAAQYGLAGALTEHLVHSNAEILVMGIIEDKEALDSIDEIAQVSGLDALLTGPVDMSASLGYPGEVNHPKVVDAGRGVVLAARRAGKIAGVFVTTPAAIPEALRDAELVLLSSEDVALRALREVAVSFEEAARPGGTV